MLEWMIRVASERCWMNLSMLYFETLVLLCLDVGKKMMQLMIKLLRHAQQIDFDRYYLVSKMLQHRVQVVFANALRLYWVERAD